MNLNNKLIKNKDIEKIIKGDEKAFLIIYNHYKNYIFKNCYICTFSKDEAMDLFQEIWLKIYFGIKKLRNIEKIDEWIKTIVRNTIINYKKKEKQINTTSIDNLKFLVDNENSFKHIEIKDEFEHILKNCSKDERYILYLKFYEGATIEEISKVFRISKSAVKMRIHRILRRLKEEYE